MKKIALLAMTVILAGTLWACAGGEEADKTAPTISGVSASGITQTGATITWTTDEPATSQVEYGLTTSYGSTATPSTDALVTSHSVPLSGLDENTTYHYRVKSKDASDNETMSADYTFTTSKIFPDEDLEAAIREAIGQPDGPICISCLAELDLLDASQRNIADIDGLEYCISLTELNLEMNRIGDLSPLADLVNLRYLQLGENQISDLSSLSSLTGLTVLHLYGNQISDITPLSNLTSLTALWLYRNQIGNTAPLSNLTTLRTLALSDNQLSDVSPLSNLTSLTYLSLRDNQISDISALGNLTTLVQLYLWNNQIGDISPLANLTNLITLYLNDNQISDITPLVDNIGLSTDDEVHLEGNPLSAESLCTLIPQLQARGVEVLYDEPQVVTFPDANLETAIREAIDKPEGDIDVCDLAGLTSLDARWRNITDVTGLEHCTSLRSLKLSSNPISDVSPLSGLTSLTYLALEGNQISNVSPLSGLTSLTGLTLWGNQISDISPLSGLTSLTDLALADNPISDASPLSGLTSLTRLYLSMNQISDISPLANLVGLTDLYLYQNQISDIGPLENLVNLRLVHLQNNQISDISPLVENTGLGEGDWVDLRGNPLSVESITTLIPQLEARGVTVYYDTGRITLQHRDSYDFSEHVRGTLGGGDFYLTQLKFFANNVGQRGVKDLGDIGIIPLDQVEIPTEGYTRFGEPAVVGHTYVSLAQQGEEGNYIVFRVVTIEGDSVTIDFLYRGEP
jgi:internalin A